MQHQYLKKVKMKKPRASIAAIMIVAMLSAFLCGFTVASTTIVAPQNYYTEEEMSSWTDGQRYSHAMADLARDEGLDESHEIIVASQAFWYAEKDAQATAEEVAATLHQFLYNGVLPYEITYDPEWEEAAVYLAKTAHGEYARDDFDQYAAIMWTILNRVDYSGQSIASVVTTKDAFNYHASSPTYKWVHENVCYDLLPLARDVLYRWRLEKAGIEDVGRVLPYSTIAEDGVTEVTYRYFHSAGDGTNAFGYKFPQAAPYWDFSGESPYHSADTTALGATNLAPSKG